MRFKINGIEYKLPASLMDITLGDRIEFDNTHGKDLKAQLKKISDMKDGPDREIEFTCYHCELACKTISFFGKISMEVIENTQIEEVLTLYHHYMKGMSEDTDFASKEWELQHEFYWNNDTWTIAAPELSHHSTMTFAEFLDAKQWMKNLIELGNDKWEALLMLACVYFRKKDEPYSEELAKENGERYQLLKKMPFQYALNTGFFLSYSVASYL